MEKDKTRLLADNGVYAYEILPVTDVTVVRIKPRNFLGMAIYVTLCCCLPCGIIGLVYSIDSSNRFDRGDYTGAVSAASKAKQWSIRGLVYGIVSIVLFTAYFILMFIWIWYIYFLESDVEQSVYTLPNDFD
ncbi:uncharacterized protein LOC117104576 [Anneissia japonica]|uniref:uncharacterized protein LOC117104576 n=1 Tax=Anneissia japonica TaxID=1529436 RepID=UPI001425A642|nr:uncharacterized protein LOC117104576 [Anneissia japonica]